MNSTFKQLLSVPLITSLLLAQTSMAGIGDILKGKSGQDYSQHPCATIIKLEEQQIDIMKSVKMKITGDSILTTTVSGAIAADSGQQAVNAALKGDALSAVLELISVYVFSKDAVKKGSEGINKNIEQKDLLNQRVQALNNLKSNPALCSNDTKSKYMLNFLDETKKINALYLEFLNKVILDAENRDTTVYTASLTVIAGLFTYATFQYYSKQTESMGRFLIAPIGAFVTAGAGIALASDLLYSKPRKNALKANRMELENKISEISELENKIKAKMN